MIYNSTKIIEKSFLEKGVKFDISESEHNSYIEAWFKVKNGSPISILFISTDDSNSVGVRIFDLITDINPNKKINVLEVLNDLNNEYRFLKFTLDRDNCINVSYDFPQETSDETLANSSLEILIRFNSIINESWEQIQKTIWNTDYER